MTTWGQQITPGALLVSMGRGKRQKERESRSEKAVEETKLQLHFGRRNGIVRDQEVSDVKAAQSHLTLCHPLDHTTDGPLDHTVDGIIQARILEWVARPLLQGIFPTQVSRIAGRFFTI